MSYAHYLVCSWARHGSGIRYPHSYATEEQCKANPAAFRFNCAQRAQTNFNEHAPYATLMMFGAGLSFPLVTVGLGLGWAVFRGIYLYGYVWKGPAGRNKVGGFLHGIVQGVLFALSAWSVLTKLLV